MEDIRCLLFGLSTSPYVFNKIMKPVINVLRGQGFLSTIYLDDILFIGKHFQSCQENVLKSKELLEKLGFVINYKKSSLIPAKKFLNAACPAVAYSTVYCKRLEREKFLALIINDGNYEAYMTVSSKLKDDLNWWKINSQIGVIPMRTLEYRAEIFSDASLTGWGAHCDKLSINGWWGVEERKRHINYLELLAAFYALKSFTNQLHDCEILLRLDNTTAIAYVNKTGGIQYPILNELARQIWQWCEEKKIWIHASYIASKENVYADAASRITNTDTEWELSEKAFQKINKKFGPFSIDLFATDLNKKVKRFCSRFPNPNVFKVDAFTISWKNEKPYAFPPFAGEVTPTITNTFAGGRSVVRQAFLRKGLDEEAADIMVNSLAKSTMKQYESSLRKWWNFT
ncbi:uncharacterized protein LOC124411349 [Diprion similis]|uniref:uncharacterized protein LOC124411349 n=1 Tax=Diprion similis TaxID=362088 RepID=UPI001EF8F2B6|nr:uncharacterized protein LOC124411349 [Diprion similis]